MTLTNELDFNCAGIHDVVFLDENGVCLSNDELTKIDFDIIHVKETFIKKYDSMTVKYILLYKKSPSKGF